MRNRRRLFLVVAALLAASACTPLGVAGDVAVGTARVGLNVVDLVI